MHLCMRIAVAALISIAGVTAFGQDNAVLLFNANPRQVCVVADITDVKSEPVCSGEKRPFLVQGKRNQLRVINRKFLTNYSFFIDSKISVANFPIEDLNEAANLTTSLPSAAPSGVSKGGVPKGLATSGTLVLRTAQDLVAELLNPATSSNPVNEISSDWLVVRREAENVRTDAISFKATWNNINGGNGVSVPEGEKACLRAYGAPTLISADACLHALNKAERSGKFSSAPYTDEDEFRRLVVKDNDAIAMVTSLGNVLARQTPLLTSQLSAFDGDLALLMADMNTLAGNVQAIQDAVDILDSITPAMTKAQIKARLMQALNGGTKPVLDDAELNMLTNEYYSFTLSPLETRQSEEPSCNRRCMVGREGTDRTGIGIRNNNPYSQFTADRPCTFDANGVSTVDRHGVELGCLADQIGLRYSYVLEQNHKRLTMAFQLRWPRSM